MKVGIAPLAVGVVVAAARLIGSDLAADVTAYVYLIVATVMMHRGLTRRTLARAPARF